MTRYNALVLYGSTARIYYTWLNVRYATGERDPRLGIRMGGVGSVSGKEERDRDG